MTSVINANEFFLLIKKLKKVVSEFSHMMLHQEHLTVTYNGLCCHR